MEEAEPGLRKQLDRLLTNRAGKTLDMAKSKLNGDTSPEQWRLVVDNHDYEVSNLGGIRRATEAKNTYVGRLLKTQLTWQGYPCATLCGPGLLRKRRTIHKLVASAFLPPDPDPLRTHVHHMNFIPTDNRVENLEWVTHPENMSHSHVAGRFPEFDRRGAKNGNSKLTADDVRAIRKMRAEWVDLVTIAQHFGINKSTVWEITSGKTWKHTP